MRQVLLIIVTLLTGLNLRGDGYGRPWPRLASWQVIPHAALTPSTGHVNRP
jgi:hypothetical protein